MTKELYKWSKPFQHEQYIFIIKKFKTIHLLKSINSNLNGQAPIIFLLLTE